MELYNKEYNDPQKIVPLQKYITTSSLNLMLWDSWELDQETIKYIKKRNEITRVANYITLLYKANPYLTAITLGTGQNKEWLMQFLNKDTDYLPMIVRDLFYRSITN